MVRGSFFSGFLFVGTAARSRAAFSLIEILVVIGILVALIVIAQPVLGTAKYRAERSASIQNLRTLSGMGELYSVDHHGDGFPYESTEWGSTITGGSLAYMLEFLPRIYGDENYNVWKRPGDDLKIKSGGRRLFGNVIPWSYARNLSLPQRKGLPRLDNTFKKIRLMDISRTMLLLETSQNAGLTYNADAQIYFDRDGLCAVAFVDGHAELLSRERLVGESATPPGSWPEDRKLLWFGYPNAVTRQDY